MPSWEADVSYWVPPATDTMLDADGKSVEVDLGLVGAPDQVRTELLLRLANPTPMPTRTSTPTPTLTPDPDPDPDRSPNPKPKPNPNPDQAARPG